MKTSGHLGTTSRGKAPRAGLFAAGQRLVTPADIERSDRRRRFESAKGRIFAEYRDLLRRLAQ